MKRSDDKTNKFNLFCNKYKYTKTMDDEWVIIVNNFIKRSETRPTPKRKRYIWVPRVTCNAEEQRELDRIGDKMTQKLYEEWDRKVVERWKQEHPNVPNSQYL